MSKVTIFKGHDFDPETFVYSAVKPNNYGGKASYINYDKHNVRIETPKMFCRWGIATYPPNDPNPTSYSMQLEFPKEMDDKCLKFHQNMEHLDRITIRTACERPKDWLGKGTLTEENAKEYYSPIVVKHTDENGKPTGKWADSLRLKLPIGKDGKFSTKCYDQNKNRVELKDGVQKGCYVKAILELNGVNLKKNAYSLSCKALQLQVFPATKFTGYAFLQDEDDDEVIVSSETTTVMPDDGNDGEVIQSESTTQTVNSDEEGPAESADNPQSSTPVDTENEGEGNSNTVSNEESSQAQSQVNANSDEDSGKPVNEDEDIPSPQPKKKTSRFAKKK